MSNKQPGQVHQEHTPQTGQEHGHVHQVQERERHEKDHLGHEKNRPGQIGANEPHDAPAKDRHAALEKSGITIYIDHKPYHAASAKLSVMELRNLSIPPIGADKNLFRVVSGNGDDIQLVDGDVIAVNMREANEGRHFFSDTIVPSKDAVARRAYYIYLEQGSQPGHDAENWAKAESEIDSRPRTSGVTKLV